MLGLGIAIPVFKKAASSGPAPNLLALDGSASNNVTSGATITATLTTTQSNDIIMVAVLANAVNIDSIADAAGLTWSTRLSLTAPNLRLFTAVAPSPLVGDVITVTFNTATTFATISAFGVSGANTTTKFDPNAAIPSQGTTSPVAFTTNNTNDMLIACYRMGTANPTAGAGWTTILGANFMLTEYKIVSATQSGSLGLIGTGDTTETRGIGDAIVSA